jgi:hypothetical protein
MIQPTGFPGRRDDTRTPRLTNSMSTSTKKMPSAGPNSPAESGPRLKIERPSPPNARVTASDQIVPETTLTARAPIAPLRPTPGGVIFVTAAYRRGTAGPRFRTDPNLWGSQVSQRRLPAPVLSLLPSQPHSTALPSPSRYGKRYEADVYKRARKESSNQVRFPIPSPSLPRCLSPRKRGAGIHCRERRSGLTEVSVMPLAFIRTWCQRLPEVSM